MNNDNDKNNHAQAGEPESQDFTPDGEYPLQKEGLLLHLQVCPKCRNLPENEYCEIVWHLYGNLFQSYP